MPTIFDQILNFSEMNNFQSIVTNLLSECGLVTLD